MLDINRRAFISRASAMLFVAPAIVRASSIMPVRAAKPVKFLTDMDFTAIGIPPIGYLDQLAAVYGVSRMPDEIDLSLRNRVMSSMLNIGSP